MDGGSEIEAVEKVIASGVQIVVGLSNDRQITFSTGFEGDEPDKVVNRRFDRIMALADRLKARYSLPETEDELAKRERTLRNMDADRARLDREHEEAQAFRREKVAELRRMKGEAIETAKTEANALILDAQDRKASIFNEGQDEWQKRGKLGAYKPQGATATNLEKLDKGIADMGALRDRETEKLTAEWDQRIADAEGEIERIEKDRTLWVTNQDDSRERHVEGIEATRKDLAKLKAMLGE